MKSNGIPTRGEGERPHKTKLAPLHGHQLQRTTEEEPPPPTNPACSRRSPGLSSDTMAVTTVVLAMAHRKTTTKKRGKISPGVLSGRSGSQKAVRCDRLRSRPQSCQAEVQTFSPQTVSPYCTLLYTTVHYCTLLYTTVHYCTQSDERKKRPTRPNIPHPGLAHAACLTSGVLSSMPLTLHATRRTLHRASQSLEQ